MAHSHDHHHHGQEGSGANPAAEHRARGKKSVRCIVVTVSDTRTMENDKSGARAAKLLEAAGHTIVERQIIPDERDQIADVVRKGVADDGIDAIVLSGGTGIAPRDVTYDVVRDLLEKPLDGFGELFRMLSYEEIGAAAMLSRAVGGVIGQTAVFALPGSSKGVALGVEKLVAPEVGHIIGLVRGPA